MLSRFLEVVAGDTLSFKVILRDGVSPVDVSTFDFSGGVRQQGGVGNIADFNFDFIDTYNGVVRVYLNPDQTKFLQNTTKLYEWYVRIQQGDYAKTLSFGALKAVRV